MTDAPALHWFRDDLRLADNPALTAAVGSGRPLAALYVLDEVSPGVRRLGGAARWWLDGALRALSSDLARHGVPLILRRGAAGAIVPAVAVEAGASLVTWNRRYGAAEQAVDATVKTALKARGAEARSFAGALLVEPWDVVNGQGAPFRVFTPFWRAARALGPFRAPLPAPARLRGSGTAPPREALEAWRLTPSKPDWAGGLRAAWTPGEAAARARLRTFLDGALTGYADGRNRPDRTSTSRLSPHLRFGEVSPATIAAAAIGAGRNAEDESKFLAEIGWREFAHHLLGQFPGLARENFQPRFDRFPWRDDAGGLRAWQRGETGYPIVDAGMRELWTTGWMHNRVRMITASFLVKHLLIDWRHGEAWFWDTLVDACPANNPASWQWVAGTGADAAPYFRIFNPVLQGEKFDPRGDYVRRFVPELARLPAAFVHRPWTAPPLTLEEAGIRLGVTYPHPIVAHDLARVRALEALRTVSDLPAGADA